MNENERPAIGSSEAAVLTVVELIARAAQRSEQHLAYWLDQYYQVRKAHEDGLAEEAARQQRKKESAEALRALLEVTADGPSTPEPAAGSKKNNG